MPNRVVIPFGALNDVPGVDGVQDVVFSIPTLAEIGDEIAEQTIDRTTLDESIIEGATDAVDLWWTSNQIAAQLLDGVAQVVVRELENALGVDVPGDGSLIDDVIAETPATEDIDNAVNDAITDQLNEIRVDVANVSIEGIFGPLGSDIEEGLEWLIEFDPDDFIDAVVAEIEKTLGIDVPGDGPLLDEIPTMDDADRIINDALDGLSPNLNGVEFWRDPIGFFEELWNELNHLLLSEASAERLRQARRDN